MPFLTVQSAVQFSGAHFLLHIWTFLAESDGQLHGECWTKDAGKKKKTNNKKQELTIWKWINRDFKMDTVTEAVHDLKKQMTFERTLPNITLFSLLK